MIATLASPAAAEEARDAVWPSVNPRPDAAAAGPVVLPPAFDLSAHTRDSFLADRAAFLGRITGAAGDSRRRADVLMDLAALHLAQVMLPEGRSILSGLSPDLLPAEAAARYHALDAALRILGGGTEPLTGDGVPLGPAYDGWPDRALFSALDHLRRGDRAGAAPDLAAAAERLTAYPATFAEEVLPVLIEAAVEEGEWDLARGMAERAGALPTLRHSDRFGFLLGLAAERNGDLLAAFDAYRDTAEGQGVAAQRARLALVRIGQKTGTLTPQEVRDLLDLYRGLWRGDALEREVLMQLVQAEYDIGHDVAAIETLGILLSAFPDTPEAAAADRLARRMLHDWYAAGAAGDIAMAQLFAGHLRLARQFRFFEGFDDSAELFADRMQDTGATGSAAGEYAALYEHLLAARDLDLWPVPPERLDHLRLKQGAALLAGGQVDAAMTVLAAPLESDDTGLHDRQNILRAEAHALGGETGGILETRVAAPPEGYLRLVAEAHFRSGDWAAARDAYGDIWDLGDAAMRPGDAINMLLSAYRTGDSDTVTALAQTFPDLTRFPQYAEIARGFDAETADPLRRAEAQEAIDQAGRTLEALRAQPAAATVTE